MQYHVKKFILYIDIDLLSLISSWIKVYIDGNNKKKPICIIKVYTIYIFRLFSIYSN